MKLLHGIPLFLLSLLFAIQAGYAQAPQKKALPARTAAAQKNAAVAAQKDSVVANNSKDYYLEVKCFVRQSKGNEKMQGDEGKPLDSVLISIYNNDIPYSEYWTSKKGKCSFRLPLDRSMRLDVTKPGFVTKSILVNTKIPADKKDAFSFSFDVDIFEEVKGLDVSVLKNPIAKVVYNSALGSFEYDVNYTTRINNDLKKMYKNYYHLQKVAADSAARANSVVTDSLSVTPKKKK